MGRTLVRKRLLQQNLEIHVSREDISILTMSTISLLTWSSRDCRSENKRMLPLLVRRWLPSGCVSQWSPIVSTRHYYHPRKERTSLISLHAFHHQQNHTNVACC